MFSGLQLEFWPKVLPAVKTYGSVFYDKLSPSIAKGFIRLGTPICQPSPGPGWRITTL
jgi:hypothetical protein